MSGASEAWVLAELREVTNQRDKYKREAHLLTQERDEAVNTTIAQQNAGAALVRAYQAKVKTQTSFIKAARYVVLAIKADRPTAHSEDVWAGINEFLEATKEYA